MNMTETRRSFAVAAFLVVVAVVSAFAVRGSAQSPASAADRRYGGAGSEPDILPALLVEVKGLRAAMEQMATSNAHAQLLVGRLQLQESRMNSMIRRLDTVRDEHAKAQTTYDQIRGQLKLLEDDPSAKVPAQEDRNEILGMFKHQIESAKAALDRWAAEETQLTSDLTA